jgi:hypothetical protein
MRPNPRQQSGERSKRREASRWDGGARRRLSN